MTHPVKQAVVALALDDTSDAAWEMASALNLAPDGRLHVCYVADTSEGEARKNPQEIGAEIERAHARVQDFVCAKLGDASNPLNERTEIHIGFGGAADQIVQLAVDVDADVIILGTREKKGLTRLFLGSVSSDVFKKAPCSVLVARKADYAGTEKTPEVEPPLAPGERPMIRANTFRYRSRPFSTYNANLFPTGIPRNQVR
jgi:nucleotide-binding universal stress UspA family protein